MVSVDQLKALNTFSDIRPQALERLATDMVSKIYLKDDEICREGEISTGIFLIASGSVAVVKGFGEDAKVVARLESQEFFGEMAFLDQAPYSATVVAEEETEILMLPRQSLNELIKRDPSAALDQVMTLMSSISSRLRRTTAESVAIFGVAKIVGEGLPPTQMMSHVFSVLKSNIGLSTTMAYYRWNPFNDEYSLMVIDGKHPEVFPSEIDANAPIVKSDATLKNISDISKTISSIDPLQVKIGHLVLTRADRSNAREALFIYYNPVHHSFDGGKRQLIETIAGVLAPALETARVREEEREKLKLEQNKQRYTI